MRKFLGILALSLGATVAYANTTSPPPSQSWIQQTDNWLDQFGEQVEDWYWYCVNTADPDQGQSTGPVAAPELDPAGAMVALTLLAGGLAVARGRRAPK